MFSKLDTQKCKGIAIIIMYIHHMYLDEKRFAGYTIDFSPFRAEHVMYIASFFKICVGMFVFLSAYGMARQLEKYQSNISYKQYCLKRSLSLYKGYWFIFFVSLSFATLTNQPHSFSSTYGTGKFKPLFYCIVDFLGLADIFKTPTFNGTWWYMGLAILIILLLPFLYQLYEIVGGILILPLSVLLPSALNLPITPVTRWLLAIMLGIGAAKGQWLEKLKLFFIRQKAVIKVGIFILSVCGLILCIKIRQSNFGVQFISIWDSIIPFYVITFSWIFIIKIKYVSSILLSLGNHSMNMFLIHTFFRQYFFKNIFYGSTNAWINLLNLFIATYLCSICIEFLKTRLNQIAKFATSYARKMLRKEG